MFARDSVAVALWYRSRASAITAHMRLVVWVVWGVLALQAGALRAQAELRAAVAAAEAMGVRAGVVVADAQGRALYRHRSTESFQPASNLKLITAASLLAGLGGDFQFLTPFELRDGSLVVHASGDPNWIVDTPQAPELMFRGVVGALQRSRATTLRGIDLRPGAFTGPARPSGWPKNQYDRYYCAPTGPFVVQQSNFVLRVAAGPRDAYVTLMAPFVAVPIDGGIRTVSKSKGAVYGAIDKTDRITVRGKFYRRSPPVRIRTAMRDPEAWFRQALEQALQAGGIRIDAGAAAPDGLLYVHRTPLRPSLRRQLADSSNFDSEQCLRVLGNQRLGDGSLAGGLRAARQVLRGLLGHDLQGLAMVDGSGLSRDNAVTPALLVEVLAAALAQRTGAELLAAMPVAGENGTLATRFAGSSLRGRVRAKTGWIRGASALSGVLQLRNGELRLFAILMNYDPGRGGLNRKLKQLQERIVAAVDADGAARE